MGNSLSLPEDLLIPFIITNPTQPRPEISQPSTAASIDLVERQSIENLPSRCTLVAVKSKCPARRASRLARVWRSADAGPTLCSVFGFDSYVAQSPSHRPGPAWRGGREIHWGCFSRPQIR